MKAISSTSLLLALLASSAAQATPKYSIVPLGFDDAEHTRNDGYRTSFSGQLNEAGQAAGNSERYNGAVPLGYSAWLYDGDTTIPIGLTGSEHRRNDGYKKSLPDELNEAGQVRGNSNRYNDGSIQLGRSAWLYNGTTTIEIGLTGTEHTRNDGYKLSLADELNEAGQARGYSERFNGGNVQRGRSAWLYNGTTTIEIGLTGTEHTRNDGYKLSLADELNEAGQVRGYSDRYNGSTYLGRSAWFYNGATTIDIGLTGAEYTRNDGYKFSFPNQLNEAGQVRGYSERYNGGTSLGRSAWFFNGVTTIDIGLTSAEYTRNDGYKSSLDRNLNEAGKVIGHSDRFDGGSVQLGFSAWLYNGTTTIDIGLTGAEHTSNSGQIISLADDLNVAGQVRGHSIRYNNGNTDLGRSAWLYNGITTIDIGLTGAEHTHNSGRKLSISHKLNQSGQVVGYAERYNAGVTDSGQSAWLYNGTTTIDIGLNGAEYTRDDGYKFSDVFLLNESGQVAGYSERYNGSTSLGQSAWYYDGTTVDIGPTGAEFTRDDGYRFNYGEQSNAAGQVIGTAERYNGGSINLGEVRWFFDPSLDQTFPLRLSTRSDGYANSYVEYFGDDGLVIGGYEHFDDQDNSLGYRAFYFTVAEGLHDLGALIDGGLSENSWNYLAVALRANGGGQILGHGLNISGGEIAFLLTPHGGLAGDYNHNGVVDAADYVVWRKNASGNYTQNDFNIWRAHFGQTAGTGAGASANATVPEPTTIVLLIPAAGWCFRRRRAA